MNDWGVFENDIGERHVIPRGDLKPHYENAGCWCDPTDDDGVWVHHSMDRRELVERSESKAQ